MGYGGKQANRSGDIRRFNFTGNGSNTAFDLGFTPATQNQLIVTVNGLVQHYDAFSISGSTLSFTGTPASGDAIQVTAVVDAVGVAAIPDGAVANVSTLTVSGNTTLTGAAAFSNTVAVTGVLTAAANVNFDSGTLFVDGTNNRVGINTTSPSAVLHIEQASDNLLDLNSTSTFNPLIQFKKAGTRVAYIQPTVNSLNIAGETGSSNTVALITGTTERMRIDSSGRVTTPYQPYFNADRASNQTGFNAASTGDVVVVYNSTTDNVGNHFNTSTGKFTAPIAGVYAFQASAYLNFNASQSWLIINGNRAAYADWNFGVNGAFTAGFWVIKLAANDSVGYHPYSGGESNGTVYSNANHTYFRGYLLG